MKKTLIALAAAAATGAFAQATVTISGNLDVAGASISGTGLPYRGTTFTTGTGTSSTSVLRFIATEDLGGGMKVTAQYNFDPRTITDDSLSTQQATETPGSTSNAGITARGLGRDEAFIGLSGGFGNIRLGAPNAISLDAHGASSPLGTGIGSGWSLTGQSASMASGFTAARYNRSIRYDSPAMGGLKVALLHAPGNDQTNTATSSVTAGTTAALAIQNARNTTEFGLSYASANFNASLAYINQAAQTNSGGFYANAAIGTAATNATSIGANLKVANTTFYVGTAGGDNQLGTRFTFTRVAVKQSLGQLDLMASASRYVTGTSTETVATVNGLRADYNLSKTAAVYLGYESGDSGTAYVDNTSVRTSSGDRQITSIGLRKSF